VPAVPIVLVAVIVLGVLSGHPALIVLVPVLVFFAIRRMAGGRGGERRGQLDRPHAPHPGP
jgi:hypothetical protein